MSKNFKGKEFKCKCGTCQQPQVNPHLVAVLELVRCHFDSPVSITSAYRCPVHNKRVGGSKKSKHVANQAADIQIAGVAPVEVYDFLDNLFPNTYGLGLYKDFTHIDVRFNKARW